MVLRLLNSTGLPLFGGAGLYIRKATMARKCSVCQHEERIEIEKAIIRNESFQNIATHFDISVGAAWRHAKSHLPETLLKSKAVREAALVATETARIEAEREADRAGANDVMAELGRCFDRANLLFEACDRWLRDPENPDQYDINPRAEDVHVTLVEEGDDGRPVRRKKRLSMLLKEIEGKGGFEVKAVETKCADPRKLVLSAIGELRELTRLQLQIFESLNDVRVVQEFQRQVLDTIEKASPEMREKIVLDLKERRAVYSVLELTR